MGGNAVPAEGMTDQRGKQIWIQQELRFRCQNQFMAIRNESMSMTANVTDTLSNLYFFQKGRRVWRYGIIPS